MTIETVDAETRVCEIINCNEILVDNINNITITQGSLSTSNKVTELICISGYLKNNDLDGFTTVDLTSQCLRLHFNNKEEVYKILYGIARLYEIMKFQEENND